MYKFSGDTLYLCANYQLANVPFAFYAKTKNLKLRYSRVDSSKPKMLWCAYFNQDGESSSSHPHMPDNLFVTGLPGASLGFEKAVNEVLSDLVYTQEKLDRPL